MTSTLFRRKADFDRNRILADAARARSRRRRHRAIALYRWVSAVEPRNPELHARLAPLLAETGQDFDAWVSYQAAASAYVRQGLLDRAVGLYREAARTLPREDKIWHAIARLQCKGGRENDALETLLEGSRQFKARWSRPQAIFLLRRAREIDRWDFECVFDLARLLAVSKQRREAAMLLDGLARRCQGAQLRRVRAAQMRGAPGLASLMRWLKLALRWETEVEPRSAKAQVRQLRPRQLQRIG